MIQIKGMSLLNIKKLFKGKYKDLEGALLSQLDPEARSLYEQALAFKFMPVDKVALIYEAAANLIYPGEKSGIRYLLGEVALKIYSGIYGIFLLIPKTTYVIRKVAAIWRSYYSEGDVSTENETPGSVDFSVSNLPGLPKAMREAITAHIEVLLAKTGAHNSKIDLDEKNPQKWIWHLSWQ